MVGVAGGVGEGRRGGGVERERERKREMRCKGRNKDGRKEEKKEGATRQKARDQQRIWVMYVAVSPN